MQKHTSANTSVNTTRLPAVYNKVDWSKYTNSVDDYYVVDIGCGRMETQILINNHLKRNKIRHFFPYDPYQFNIVATENAKNIIENNAINKVVVCSNVLNVIDNDEALTTVIAYLCDAIVSVTKEPDGVYKMNPCYITVYEGNKSGIGKETKKDCWQRNERLSVYLKKFNDYINKKYNHNASFFKIKHGMIVGTIQ
jgi:hypothetical protein